MSTDDVAGEASRLDQLLDEYAAGLLDRKKRLETVYAEKRAARAESKGNLDAAEAYYDRARSLRGKLGDREASIDLGLQYAKVARENGNLDTAQTQFERVVELHARRKNAVGALDALEPLLELLEAEGKDDDLKQWWGHTMMVLGKAEPGEVPQERHEALVDQYAEQIRSEDSAGQLYGMALNRFLDGDEDRGAYLLDAAWERRTVVREAVGQFRLVLAAGVGRVAHAEVAGRDVDREETLDYVADHREKLSEAASALFERLYDGETDADPESFKTGVDPNDEVELRTLEADVFGRFLDDLT